LLAVLRSSPVTAQIPFVMMSGFRIAHASSPMPDGFLPKPFGREDLSDIVRSCVHRTSTLEQSVRFQKVLASAPSLRA